MSAEQHRNWLIYDRRSECYWGPNNGGYWKSIVDAGLYTEREAKDAEDFAKRYHRHEVAVPLEQFREKVTRLAEALDIPLGGASMGTETHALGVREDA